MCERVMGKRQKKDPGISPPNGRGRRSISPRMINYSFAALRKEMRERERGSHELSQR